MLLGGGEGRRESASERKERLPFANCVLQEAEDGSSSVNITNNFIPQGEMSELTKTNAIQTTINPGRPSMVKVEMSSEPQGEEGDMDLEVPEEGESVEVAMAHAQEVSSNDQLISSDQQDLDDNSNSVVTSAVSDAVKQQQNAVVQQKFQDVRVDNWGNYCLQRLQVMYDRGDFCDLTMQFHTNQLLKVHRVVVNLCTEYFANLERLFGLSDGVLVLPKDVEYQAMVTIVKFFYTGKLEIRGNQFNEVYRTVKLMNITILTKLLEAHAKKPVTPTKKEPTRPIVFKQAVERPLQKGQQSPGVQLSGTHVKFGGNTIQGAGGTKTLQLSTPGTKLPPGATSKTVLARVQTQGVRLHQQGMNKGGQKKLPFWKERKFGPGSDPLMTERWPLKDEPARPTRFEWGDPDDDPLSLNTGPVVSHSLMEKQKASGTIRKAEDIFDAVKTQTLGKRNALEMAKNASQPLQPPTKIGKVISVPCNELIQISHNDDVNLTEDTVEEEVSTTEVNIPPIITVKKNTTILKPALKSQATRLTPMVGINDPNLGDLGKSLDSPTASSSRMLPHPKTVRFAPDIEKENSKGHDTELSTEEDVTSSHSKIIAEVLKKYPDLVKDKQNIKLKIVQKGSDSSPSKDKAKVSYIVLKSTSSPESLGAVLLKKPNNTSTNRSFWDGVAGVEKEKKPSGAENTAGPWLCGPCGGDETPMELESYYVYRRHLVEVHGERIDARICEYCGQKASKRNLLLYHLYTKHGVIPPKNMHFPNCDRCDYIALSESLLNKHKLTHDATKEYSCHICNASFKSTGAHQSHMAANLHRNKDTKVYECPYCRKPFVRNINLKLHIRQLHREVARIEEMEDPRLPHDDTLIHRPVTLSTGRKRQFPSILGSRSVPSLEILPGDGSHHHNQQVSLVTADGHTIEIIHGIDPLDPNSMSVPMTLVPSSEAEAMTNVASSIAASLGLEQGVHGSEFMSGDGSQAVYIMDNSQPAVEVDMSAMGLASDGTMIYDGEDPNGEGQFIVQDVHGNQFRKMTGIDESGKPVIFFQLSEDHNQMGQTILEEGIQITSENSSVYVSSDMNVPVSADESNQEETQVILAGDGHDEEVYGLLPNQEQESHDQVIMDTDHDQEIYHEETIQHDPNVEQLHIVLNQNDEEDEQDRTHTDLIIQNEPEYVHNTVEEAISEDSSHEAAAEVDQEDDNVMLMESGDMEQDVETQVIDGDHDHENNVEEQEDQVQEDLKEERNAI